MCTEYIQSSILKYIYYVFLFVILFLFLFVLFNVHYILRGTSRIETGLPWTWPRKLSTHTFLGYLVKLYNHTHSNYTAHSKKYTARVIQILLNLFFIFFGFVVVAAFAAIIAVFFFIYSFVCSLVVLVVVVVFCLLLYVIFLFGILRIWQIL